MTCNSPANGSCNQYEHNGGWIPTMIDVHSRREVQPIMVAGVRLRIEQRNFMPFVRRFRAPG